MRVVGPDIREMTRHLANCPRSFLEEPTQPSGFGGVHVDAVISDLLVMLGGARLTAEQAQRFRYKNRSTVREERNRLRVSLLAAWIFCHRDLRDAAQADRVKDWLLDGTGKLSEIVVADDLVVDSERREELVRLCMSAIDLRPLGESQTEAENRLAALSSVERERVIAESRAAQERARLVREKLAEQERARKAASVYTND